MKHPCFLFSLRPLVKMNWRNYQGNYPLMKLITNCGLNNQRTFLPVLRPNLIRNNKYKVILKSLNCLNKLNYLLKVVIWGGFVKIHFQVVMKLSVIINPFTPKIWLLTLPSSCSTYPCKLVERIWG